VKIKRARVAIATILAAGTILATTAGGTAMADNGSGTLHVRLSGYQEDPLVISTNGSGRFRLKVDEGAQTATYQLSYSSLEGVVTQAHIHLGGRAQSGGIMVFLCTNLGNATAETQSCPAAPAEITGTIRAGDILAIDNQSLPAGQFNEFLAAIRAGATYVNVHTSAFMGGEIRAQLDHKH
jgi:CHRD domain